MAAASYTTDLVTLNTGESTTNWTEPTGATGGGVAVAETDYFIQGTGCISKTFNATGLGGLHYNNGAGVTIPTDGAYLAWVYFGAPNAINTLANGGIRLTVGSGVGDYKMFYVLGSDTYAYGGWRNIPADPTLTADATQGTPTTTRQYFGMVANVSNAVSKGNPFGVDAIRYGRCEMRINGGDLANGYATFAGAATQNDSTTNRWGLIQAVDGGFLWKGLITLGYTSAVDFRDSNTQVLIDDTTKVSANFNKIEIRQTTSRIDWTSVSFLALGTVSKGRLEVIDDCDVNIEACTFTDMDTFVFKSLSTVNASVFSRCGQITANSAAITNSDISGYTGASNTSALVWDTAVDPDGLLDGTTFTKGAGTTHAIEFGTSSPTSMTLTDVNFSGYNASNGQNDSAIHIKRTSGTVTINITGGNTPSYRTDGATVVIVAGAVSATLTSQTADGTPVIGANVHVYATSTTGSLPVNASVTISNSGTTATVTHTGHGLSTNDKIWIKGASLNANNGVFSITSTGANTYTYTMASSPGSSPTGTITATFVILNGTTNASGQLTMSRVFPANQSFAGWARKSTSSPLYKTAPVSGTVNASSGVSITALMLSDE